MRPPPPRLISSQKALDAASRQWARESVLGLDTEFVRTRTYYARLGLIQVADASGVRLLDAVEIPTLEPFEPILRDPGVERVLHSCGEDLGAFLHHFGALPPSIFDTQVAASLVGLGFSLSYQALVGQVLGVRLAKEETRSDWTARPLSEAQLEYAARDVAHLLPLHQHLLARLRELGRESWAREEFARLLDPARYEVEPGEAFLRVKGAGGLDRRGLAVLKAVCEWREEEARRSDLARPFVVRDEALLELARRRPRRDGDLREIAALPARERRRYGRALLDAIERAARVPEAELPRHPARAPRVERASELVKGLQALVASRARELGVAPEMLAHKRMLERLVREVAGRGSRELPPELEGWRREVVGIPALSYLDSAV
ncbi:MAG TPA: ribonuclease D, partial [Thermoanaerobaculia bacterium]|nr:ribonuclease D [Thermoanaerobaculia bacterium]